MSLGEFSLIQQFFSRPSEAGHRFPPELGIGDDAAVLNVPAGYQLVQTIDTLIAGRHFPLETAAADVAYKAVAVNVSDLVAMAADPAWFVLALSIPESETEWLSDFSAGLFAAAEEFSIELIGGDTCKGDLSITIQASGLVPANDFVTRQGAQVGDRIFVSGQVGTAALALAAIQGQVKLSAEQTRVCLPALNRPKPVLALIPLLRAFATAAIDISDGLSADLGHILQQSKVGASLKKRRLPVHPWIQQQGRYDLALDGGDDYQVVFSVNAGKVDALTASAASAGVSLTEIGEITGSGYILVDGDQQIDLPAGRGFDHFG